MKVTARAVRSGEWWAIEVPEVAGVFTRARRLDQVEAVAADAVATMLDLDPSEVDVEVATQISDERLREIVAGAGLAKDAAAHAESVAARRMRLAVLNLRDAGYSVRDVGAILRVSHQRVSQLEKSAR